MGILLTGADVLKQSEQSFVRRDVFVDNGTIQRLLSPGDSPPGTNFRRIDCEDRYVVPGFMDAHFHPEPTLVHPRETARLLLEHGTTSVFMNPHEIANVAGMEGVRWLIEAFEDTPLRTFLVAPVKVPTAPELESSGAAFDLEELEEMSEWSATVGMGEFNGSNLLMGDPRQNRLLKRTVQLDLVPCGHAPGILGEDLKSLHRLGIRDDHESKTAEEIIQRARVGMTPFLREGTTERHLRDIVPEVTDHPDLWEKMAFCTDDKHVQDLLEEGHIDHNVRTSSKLGLPLPAVLSMATGNCARHYRLDDRLGFVEPGQCADLVVLKQDTLEVDTVVCDGNVVSEGGRSSLPAETRVPKPGGNGLEAFRRNIQTGFSAPGTLEDYLRQQLVPAVDRTLREVSARTLTVEPDTIFNTMRVESFPLLGDGGLDIGSIPGVNVAAVVESYGGKARAGMALVRGFNLSHGAIASSFAHDHHNLIGVGADIRSLVRALQAVGRMGGGFVIHDQGSGHELPLPVAGLMSDRPAPDVAETLRSLKQAANNQGCELPHPFMTLSFLSLPTVGDGGLTDRGLVNVAAHDIVPLFVTES